MTSFLSRFTGKIPVLSFLFLFLWFHFEVYLHNHPAALLAAVVISWGIGGLLFFTLTGKTRILLTAIWLGITVLFTMDYIQLQFLSEFSESSFASRVDRSIRIIKGRAEKLMQEVRDDSAEVEKQIARAGTTKESIFIDLQQALQNRSSGWALYDQNGQLLAWDNGSFSSREIVSANGSPETSVVSILHQHFLKYKRAVTVHGNHFEIVVQRVIGADYGLNNRYLHRFNVLTNDLTVRPDLLYSSPETTARSADYVIRKIDLTQDFSIALLFSKKQYDEYFAAGVFRLHWWLELLVLIFFLLAGTHLFFAFVRFSGENESSPAILMRWIVLVLASGLCLFTIRYFSSFAADSLFLVQDSEPMKWEGIVRSSGGLFFSSYFAFNLALSLALMIRKRKATIPWKHPVVNYGLLLACIVVSGFLFAKYQHFCTRTLPFSTFDPVNLSVFEEGILKVTQVVGMLWLDLAFVLLISLLYVVIFCPIRRTPKNFMLFVSLQSIVAVLLHRSLGQQVAGGWTALFGLYFSIGFLTFFLPVIAEWFGRLNFLSRFLVILLLCSLVSFLFHSSRFHHAGGWQREFIEKELAPELIEQRTRTRQLLINSQEQLDRILLNISVDPKISDLAYRLWARTDMARYGYKSAIEIYDESGNILNRFSVGLPRLAIPWEGLLESTTWFLEERSVPLGTTRKPVQIGVRSLPGGGYLVAEVVMDYENLPFVSASSPFQELFKPSIDARLFGGSFLTYTYDQTWRPVFLSRPDLSPSTLRGKELLKNASSAWSEYKAEESIYNVYYFRLNDGYAAFMIPQIAWRTHVVHWIDLLLYNLLWLSSFVLVLAIFIKEDLLLHFHVAAATRFNFFQKMLFAFVVFSMVPMLSLSWLIRNYVWQKQFQEVSHRALTSFAVATRVVGDYLSYRVEEQGQRLFSNELLEWISQVIQQDVSFYYDRYLLATSNREFYSAGLLSEQIQGKMYVDLFLKGQKFSIDEVQISGLKLLNVSGRIHTGKFRDEVITLPFLIDERAVEQEIASLREYLMLVGGGVVLFAVLFGYILASRFSKPVVTLIRGTGEMSRGNLQYRIREQYQDEFQQLVNSFNAMAASLDEQQDALERRRAYIENILKNITTAVISINSTMNVTTINPAAAKMFRIDPDYGGLLLDLIQNSQGADEAAPAIRKFLEQKEQFQLTEVAFFRTNSEVHWRIVFVPLFEEGEWAGAVLLVEDITDIIRSNRLSAWAEMARRVAHEVKNPLTPIQLSIEHLVRVSQDKSENFNEVLKSCSEAILKQVRILRRLVSEFSQYGRPPVLNPAELDLKSFLEEIISGYQTHLPAGIQMDVKIQKDLPPVRIDPEKFRSALLNIIENGLQATDGSGKILLKAEAKDNQLAIEVGDTGPGIPEEILPRLFEPYFSTKSGGTGLGLAIAQKNIQDHGGSIRVESKPGQGTRVTIVLPIREKRTIPA